MPDYSGISACLLVLRSMGLADSVTTFCAVELSAYKMHPGAPQSENQGHRDHMGSFTGGCLQQRCIPLARTASGRG